MLEVYADAEKFTRDADRCVHGPPEECETLRQYDLLSKLSSVRQRKAIHCDRNKEQAQTQAAPTIRAVLAHQPQRIDLGLIARKIIAAIRGKTAAL